MKKTSTEAPGFLLGGSIQLTGPGVWGDAPRRDEAKRVLGAAVDGGANFIDTADAYGPRKMQAKLGSIALKNQAAAAQFALAWLLKRSFNILLIPGASSAHHLRENLAAVQIELSDEDFSVLSN